MKIVKVSLILSILTFNAVAESPPVINVPLPQHTVEKKLNDKKEKRLNSITQKINNIEKRKICMSQATSLTEMQGCRIEKNKNKLFKLKKGMSFEQKQKNKIKKMNLHIDLLNRKKLCVSNATTIKALRSCKQTHLKPMVKPLFSPQH